VGQVDPIGSFTECTGQHNGRIRGAPAWDTFQTTIATATKLGVRVYAYFLRRLVALAIAEHIRERARAAIFLHSM
jgi:hypothetical protein